jgi:hypothetical protein
MTDDPLAKFRSKAREEAPANGSSEIDTYEAFKAVDRRQLRLQVRPASRAWERLPSGYLIRIVEDGGYWTMLSLVYTFMVVVVIGRNLREIGDAIGDERCEFIQEFDASKWEKPADDKAPFIESITIHEKRPASDGSADQNGGTKH